MVKNNKIGLWIGIAVLVLVVIGIIFSGGFTGKVVKSGANQTGSLSVTSNPTGANLFVDSVFKGTTPRTVSGLSVGNHNIKVTKSGYNNYITTKYISIGNNSLNVTLSRKLN